MNIFIINELPEDLVKSLETISDAGLIPISLKAII
jgi:hypothetical protein